eukprot:scaffold78196_cov25-Tisochrysis_lutea.AAC.1
MHARACWLAACSAAPAHGPGAQSWRPIAAWRPPVCVGGVVRDARGGHDNNIVNKAGGPLLHGAL